MIVRQRTAHAAAPCFPRPHSAQAVAGGSGSSADGTSGKAGGKGSGGAEGSQGKPMGKGTGKDVGRHTSANKPTGADTGAWGSRSDWSQSWKKRSWDDWYGSGEKRARSGQSY